VSDSTIRPARADDLEPILALADDRRRQYASYQPVFWRPAPDAAARQRIYLDSLIADVTVITLVAICDQTFVGFVIGHLVPAPAVYDPGGPTCTVDDFTVDHPESWATVGVDLLNAIQEDARHRGAAQLVVVCGQTRPTTRHTRDVCGHVQPNAPDHPPYPAALTSPGHSPRIVRSWLGHDSTTP